MRGFSTAFNRLYLSSCQSAIQAVFFAFGFPSPIATKFRSLYRSVSSSLDLRTGASSRASKCYCWSQFSLIGEKLKFDDFPSLLVNAVPGVPAESSPNSIFPTRKIVTWTGEETEVGREFEVSVFSSRVDIASHPLIVYYWTTGCAEMGGFHV